MTKTAAFLAAVLLAGCATSPASMEQPQNAASFMVDQPYQLTLKRIVEADQNCSGGMTLPVGSRINDVQHYPDLREAKIVQGAEGFGRQIHRVISVKEVDGRSEVTLYAKASRAKIAEVLERWANGDPACP